MKKTLLTFGFLTSFGLSAQNPVTAYLPQDNSMYAVYDTASGIDQSAVGANVNWNFTGLVAVGETHFDVDAATAEMIATFPNTTHAVHQTGTSGESYLFVNQTGSNLSLTGTDANGIVLNYTNNAFVGALPMTYGYTQTDAIAGTYVFDAYSGPFSGTITTTVDAYGTLTVNGVGPIAVTRVKTVQNISLTYLGIPNIGTGVQTTYSYYDESGIMQFTTSTLAISAPLAGINETLSTILGYMYTELGTPQNVVAKFSVYPNPTSDLVNINADQPIDSIQFSDVSGKVVMTVKNPVEPVNISELASGIYVVTIASGGQTSVQKLVKR